MSQRRACRVAGQHRATQRRPVLAGADEERRLRELEAENARLKKLVANQALDIDMLKELAEGNF